MDGVVFGLMILIRMAARFFRPYLLPTTVYTVVFYLHIFAIKSNLITGPAHQRDRNLAAGA
jgi:hypothetical protein